MTARPTLQSPAEALASYVHAILFETLDPAEVQRIAGDLAWVHLPPGGVLFPQDGPSDAMYVVVEGELQVRIAGPEAELRDRREPSARVG